MANINDAMCYLTNVNANVTRGTSMVRIMKGSDNKWQLQAYTDYQGIGSVGGAAMCFLRMQY